MCPGKPEYTIGTPLFRKATIKLENGKSFVVEARNYAPGNIYVAGKSLNGKTIKGWTLQHADIMRGGVLRFDMSAKPVR